MTQERETSMIIIYGCGQMGSQLARDLSARGEEVTVVDSDRGPLEELAKHFKGRMVMGLGIDREVLRRAEIERADCFIAVSRDINTNVMAAQVAKRIFNVPRVIARIEHPELVRLYSTMGIEAVSPTLQGAQHIGAMVVEA